MIFLTSFAVLISCNDSQQRNESERENHPELVKKIALAMYKLV